MLPSNRRKNPDGYGIAHLNARTDRRNEIGRLLKVWRNSPNSKRGKAAKAGLKELGVTVGIPGEPYPFVVTGGIRQMPRRAKFSNPNLDVLKNVDSITEWVKDTLFLKDFRK